MAKSKKVAETALVQRATAALEPYEEEMAAEAKNERSQETLGIPRISTKGGTFKIDNNDIGKKIKLAVVDFIYEKAYYSGAFDPSTPATPDCYAFARPQVGEKPGETEARMVAHEAAPNKQNLAGGSKPGESPCRGCKWNEFETAEVGRGKRCKDVRRVLVLSPRLDLAGKPVVDDSVVAKAEVRQLSFPPASLKWWSAYYGSLGELTRTGNIREAIMEVEIINLPSGGHGLKPTFAGQVTKEGLKAISELRKAREGALTQPYPVIAVEETEKVEKKANMRKRVGR
jgi:hypothetical protein